MMILSCSLLFVNGETAALSAAAGGRRLLALPCMAQAALAVWAVSAVKYTASGVR